jgi:Co/Zn/Cd efflux system component
MSAHCEDHGCAAPITHTTARYRRVLWFALVVNALMFVLEIGAGLASGSTSLLADAIDFFGDAANYALALWALGMAPVWGSRVALLKALSMLAFGIFVLSRTAWAAWSGVVPQPITMGVVGFLALAANISVAFALYSFRDGNANMQSVWLCTRNDAIGNIAVLIAAAGVWGAASGWPDWLVAAIMGGLALSSGWRVLKLARSELRESQSEHKHEHAH